MAAAEKVRGDQKFRSLFDLPPDFFDSCRLLCFHSTITAAGQSGSNASNAGAEGTAVREESLSLISEEEVKGVTQRWTCGTCKLEFESLQDQRSHFQSDLHRLNIKLSFAGKNIVKEEEFDENGRDASFQDFDVSSISGSEDETEKDTIASLKAMDGIKLKLYFRLHSRETISLQRSLLLDEFEDVSFDAYKMNQPRNGESALVMEGELISRLKYLVHEPRDKTHLRIVLLLSGGHFAGCVFDGNLIIAHKTFHRTRVWGRGLAMLGSTVGYITWMRALMKSNKFTLYVVRAKAGKKQSTKDGTGKSAHSAGSSLRRHNEAALKKAEKDSKRKAKAKELKKLRKAKERAKAQETMTQDVSRVALQHQIAVCLAPSKQLPQSNARVNMKQEGTQRVAPSKQQPKSNGGMAISKEEEERLAIAAEREKRAAAAEKRIAALKIEGTVAVTAPGSSVDTKGVANDLLCSCCNASLAGKIPFHRYHYKYCSTSCMHIHREILEDI